MPREKAAPITAMIKTTPIPNSHGMSFRSPGVIVSSFLQRIWYGKTRSGGWSWSGLVTLKRSQ